LIDETKTEGLLDENCKPVSFVGYSSTGYSISATGGTRNLKLGEAMEGKGLAHWAIIFSVCGPIVNVYFVVV